MKYRNVAIAGLVAVGLLPFVKNVILDCANIVVFYIRQQRIVKGPKQLPIEPEQKQDGGYLYVALGSSFASGPSVGNAIPNSVGQGSLSYPFLLAKKLQLSSKQFMHAGRSGARLSKMEKTQMQYLGPNTKLVTITAGGNDVNYSKDTLLAGFLASRKSENVKSVLTSRLKPLKRVADRPFDELSKQFDATFKEIQRRSPNALIVVVTYLTIMPSKGELPPLNSQETQILADVAEELRKVTVRAARRNNVVVVDMAKASTNHHAAADQPWSSGLEVTGNVLPVHPTVMGHSACADDIYATLLELNFIPELKRSVNQ